MLVKRHQLMVADQRMAQLHSLIRSYPLIP